MVNQDTLTEIVSSLKTTEKQTDHTYQAVVSRIDKDGSVWVNIAGSEQETPTEAVSTEVKRGDAVTVEWRNNKLYVAGNYSSPSAGIERVMEVDQKATNALTDATVAHEAAVMAVDSAGIAGRAASVAQTAAEAAQATANSKKRVFTSQPVPPYSVGDLWVDTSGGVQNGDSLGYGSDAYSALVGTGQVGYMVVGGVAPEQESVVYVCTFARSANESFNENDWQLAATDDGAVDELREWFWHDANGAHILGDVSGYRNDISSTGMKIMDTSTETSVAEFGANGTQIGKNASGNSRTEIRSTGMKIVRNVSGTDTQIAVLGFESGTSSGGGTADAPYYTFGTRRSNTTIGNYSIAEGLGNAAIGYCSHAEGQENYASGESSHAEGENSIASNLTSHAEGYYSTASGLHSHSQNLQTIAQRKSQTAIGEYNVADTAGADRTARGDYALIIGNGTADNARSNALTVDWTGNVTLKGHSSAVGTVLSNTWTATSNSASGTSMTGTINLTPGTWMLGMITPTCSASIAYYFTNLSSTLTYPYFNMGTGGSGWVPVVITANTTTRVASGASASVTYSNTDRGRIFAIRII